MRRRPVHTPTDHFDTFHQLTRFPPHTSFAYQRKCSTKVKHLMANLCSIAFMAGCGGCEMQCLLYSTEYIIKGEDAILWGRIEVAASTLLNLENETVSISLLEWVLIGISVIPEWSQ